MFPLFKSEVKTYHTFFHKERKKAFEGLAFLTSIANEISSAALSCNDELELTAKLKMLKRFSQIFEEFNHDVELAMSQFEKRMVEVGRGNAVAVDRDYLLIGEPSRIPKVDLSIYKIGDRGKCVISYIKSVENDLCFIVDLNRSRSTDFKDHLISHYDGLPDIGTVFAILVENKYFRAIRTHSESTLISYQVTLIDVGETISMPLYRSEKYQLSPDASQLPPMAILCLVEKADGTSTNCLQRLLGGKRFNFQIVNICANMLQVELYTENENTVTSSISQPSTPLLSRRSMWENLSGNFSTSSMSQPTTPVISRRNIFACNPRDTNPFRAEQMNQNALDRSTSNAKANVNPNIVSISPCSMEKNDNHQSDWLTNKNHRNIVNRLGTSDGNHSSEMNNFNDIPVIKNMLNSACPKEDNNGTCETGAHPKNAQSSEQNGCDSYDQNENVCLTKLSSGQETAVITSAVVGCDEIYVQLVSSANRFAEFQQNLNQNVVIRCVTKLPSVGETVLARYDVDGLMYRARVTKFIDRHSLLVLYVDYGNTERVTLDSVFEWEPFCDSLPFQAIKCTLANVNVKDGAEREVKDFLFNNILNKSMTATMISTVANRIMVRLTKDGVDIADELNAKCLTTNNAN